MMCIANPLNLHVTPTLASALEWAKVTPDVEETWRLGRTANGPLFNDWIGELAAAGTVHLLGSTFSDHMLSYFTPEYNRNNVALAEEFLQAIYGVSFDEHSVFWPPERVLDADVFSKIRDMGYSAAVIDQNTHMWNWFGRQAALSDDGYRINKIHDVNCFVINNNVESYRYDMFDHGPAMALRNLFSRRSRSWYQDHTISMFYQWSDFTDAAKANDYDTMIRWVANHPWVQLVAYDDILAGSVAAVSGDNWNPVDRDGGGYPSLSKDGNDWLNHATEGNYDNWYLGSDIEESLANKYFQVRDGVSMPTAYGMLYTGGVVSSAWDAVSAVSAAGVSELAEATLHASVFQTAFHNETDNDLSKFSTGSYVL